MRDQGCHKTKIMILMTRLIYMQQFTFCLLSIFYAVNHGCRKLRLHLLFSYSLRTSYKNTNKMLTIKNVYF